MKCILAFCGKFVTQSSIDFKCDLTNQSKHRLDTTDFPCQIQCNSDFGKKKYRRNFFGNSEKWLNTVTRLKLYSQCPKAKANTTSFHDISDLSFTLHSKQKRIAFEIHFRFFFRIHSV